MRLKNILMLSVAFIVLAIVSVYAQTTDPAAVTGLPKWVTDVLALLGIAGVGGVGVFASVAKKVAAAEAKYLPIIQGLKNVIDKNATLFAEIKIIVASSPAIPSWNAAMKADSDFFKAIPLAGIEAKADIFNRLIITLPVAEPAILKKVEAVAEKVEQVVNAIPTA
jgi:hypothetical protein